MDISYIDMAVYRITNIDISYCGHRHNTTEVDTSGHVQTTAQAIIIRQASDKTRQNVRVQLAKYSI
jgi:hypothetical protein